MALILSGDTGVPSSGMPTGSVIQTVNATYSTETSFTTNAWTDSGVTATITPTSATSKILVVINLVGCIKQSTDTGLNAKIVRNSTDLITFANQAGRTGTTTQNDIGSISSSYLDSPATTSATTYKVQALSSSNSSLARICQNNSTSTITLLEIKQ